MSGHVIGHLLLVLLFWQSLADCFPVGVCA